MSSISLCTDSSKVVIGSVRRRRTSSPYLRITSPFFEALDHRFDGVLRALFVELIEDFANARVSSERVVEFFLVEAQQLRRLRSGDRRGARLSGQYTHLAEEIAFAEFREVDAATPLPGAAGVDLHFPARNHVHRQAGLSLRDDDVAFAMLLELHLFHQRGALFVIQHFEERALRKRTAEHRLAFAGRTSRRRGRARRFARLLRFLAYGDRLHGQSVVVVVLGGALVLGEGLFVIAVAGERIGILQTEARVARIFVEVFLEKRDRLRELLPREEICSGLFSHASSLYLVLDPLQFLLRGAGRR